MRSIRRVIPSAVFAAFALGSFFGNNNSNVMTRFNYLHPAKAHEHHTSMYIPRVAHDHLKVFRPSLPLEDAEQILDRAIEIAKKNELLPLTVAVLDAGGHLICLKRQDGSGILRVKIAISKAWGALGMGMNSRELKQNFQDRPNFVSALTAVSDGKFVPAPGGVLILDNEGYVIGAIGVSGDVSEKDEMCAILAVRDQSGYAPSPSEPTL